LLRFITVRQQYVDVDTCGKFGNYIMSVITSFLFVSHVTVRESWRVDLVDVQQIINWRHQLIHHLWQWW